MSGPVVLVTGASLGIGAAITNTLLAKNARVVLIDLSGAELKLQQEKHGKDNVQYVVGDVSKDETNISAVKLAITTWGKLDSVVLNAGIMAPVHRLDGASAEAWERIFRVNVCSQVSAVYLPTPAQPPRNFHVNLFLNQISASIPILRKCKGRIIFTSSDAGLKPTFPAWSAYGATKAAVNYIISAVTLEEPEITAIGLYPGIVDTPLVHRIFEGGYPGMTQEELEHYTNFARDRLVKAEGPGTVMANLALRAEKNLRGVITFWDDEKFKGFA